MFRGFTPCTSSKLILTWLSLSLYAATISAKQPRDNFSYDNVSANTKRQTGVSEATKKTCPECYGRGYCEEIDGDIKCLCFEQFYEGADCMTEVNHCKTNPCENDGDCQSVWGNYFCKCRKGFHGVNCTEQGEIKRVARPQFLYNIEVRVPSEDAFILLLDGAKTSSMGEEFSLDYETGTGMKFFAKKLELIKNPRKLAKKYELDPSILHHFPKENKMGYIIRGYSYTTDGGPVYISIKIKNKNTVQFEGRYLVVPKKNPSFCTPTIVMQDCATEYDKAPMYKRGERFSVRSKTTPECTDQEPQLSQYWFQYNISDDAPVPTSDTFRALDTDWNSPTEYAFQPFTMNFGFYLMKVAVLEKVNEIMGARKSSFWNENMCGFHIVPADLVACMVGGESGTVGVHQELRLSAELSYDPNESPYNQQHLRYKWSCSISKHSEGQYCKGKGVQVGTGVLLSIPKDQLQVGSVYEFMVEVWSTKPPVPGYTVNPSNATKKVTVIEGRPAILALEYVKNVGPYFQSNPEEIVYLKVVCEAECADTMEEMKYEWIFEPAEGSKKTLDWKHDTQFGQNTDKLLILENKLTQSETYLISVTGGHKDRGQATMKLKVNTPPTMGRCAITPDSGKSGVTKFHITCEGFIDEDKFPLTYEFFQDADLDNPGLGVLLSYKLVPNAPNLVLMEGKEESGFKTELTVRVSDHWGMNVLYNFTAVVKPITDSDDPEELLKSVTSVFDGNDGDGFTSVKVLVEGGDMSGKRVDIRPTLYLFTAAAVRTVSALADALDRVEGDDTEMNDTKQELRGKFVDVLEQLPMNSMMAVTQISTALQKVLGNEYDTVDDEGANTAANVIEDITIKLFDEVVTHDTEDLVSTKDIETVVSAVMQCTATLMSTAGKVVSDLSQPDTADNTGTTAPDPESLLGGVFVNTNLTDADYPLYEDLDLEVIAIKNNFQTVSRKTLASMDTLGSVLAHRLAEGESPTIIDIGNMNMYIKSDQPTAFVGKILGVGEKDQVGVKISKELAQELESKHSQINIQVTISKDNMFAWYDSGSDMNTEVMMVDIKDPEWSGEVVALDSTTEFLDIFMKIHPEEVVMVKGEASAPVGVTNPELLEDHITVHRLTTNKGDSLYIEFDQLKGKLQVVVMVDWRPEAEDFSLYGETVPTEPQEGLVIKSKESATHDDAWFYVAVLPHHPAETLRNNTEQVNISVDYSFKVFTTRCQYWDEVYTEWSTHGCKVGDLTSLTKLHCRCQHLSAFGGSFLIPPNKLDPIHDVIFFLTVVDNPVVVSFVSILLFLYVLLLVWARWKDNKDQKLRRMTFLEDNIPGDKYAYVVVVFTGRNKDASTTAKVAIKLEGRSRKGKPHILVDQRKKLFERGSDDWFIMCTSKSLGELLFLHLWHDSSGTSPAWFCEKVIVQDIQTSQIWTFIVNDWLSVVHKDGKVYRGVSPATEAELNDWRNLLRDHAYITMREEHIWLRIFTRHPRSNFTRVQRVSVATCILMTCMLANIMFYGVPDGSPSDQIDIGSIQISMAAVMMGLEGALLSYPINLVIIILFRQVLGQLVAQLGFYQPDNKSNNVDMKSTPFEEDLREGITQETTRRVQQAGRSDAAPKESDGEERKRTTRLSWLAAVFLSFFAMDPLVSATMEKEKTQEERRGRTKQMWGKVRNSLRGSRKKKVLRKYWFPSWCIILSWVLCILTILLSAYLTMLYGLSYGKLKSLLWMSSIFYFFIISLIVIQPIKIIIIALVLTWLFKQQHKYSKYEWDVSMTPDNVDKSHFESMNYSERRKYWQLYRPMTYNHLQRAREKEKLSLKLSEMLSDLIMYLVYFVTLYWVVLANRDDMLYYSNNNMLNMVIFGKYTNSLSFEDIYSDETFKEYISKTLLPAIHGDEWYNGEPLNAPGIGKDTISLLLGVPRLRQLRVINNTCKPPTRLKPMFKNCYSEFSIRNEDRNDYGMRWTPFRKAEYKETRARDPWLYKTTYETGSLIMMGVFATYPGGGYIAPLGRTRNNSMIVLEFLLKNNWLDHHTRAIFIEFTTYNVNQNCFNIITLLTERSPTGSWATQFNIKTVKFLFVNSEMGYTFLIAFGLFVVVLLLFVWRQWIKLKRTSIHSYVKDVWNSIDVLVIVLAFTSIGIFFVRSSYVLMLLRIMHEAEMNEYVSFSTATYWDLLLTLLIALLIGLSTIRLWKLLHFGRSFQVVETTLVECRGSLTALFIFFVLLITAYATYMLLFMGGTHYKFHSLYYSVTTIATSPLYLAFDFNYNLLQEGDRFWGPIIYTTFKVGVCMIFMSMFVTIIMVYYNIADINVGLRPKEYTLLDYIVDEIKLRLGYFTEKEKRRLRGGADQEPLIQFVVPKPENLRHINAVGVSKWRMHAITRLTIDRVKKDRHSKRRQRIGSMAALTLGMYRESEGGDAEEIFYRGVKDRQPFLVPERTLEEMELAINKMATEKLTRKKLEHDIEKDADIPNANLEYMFNNKLDSLMLAVRDLRIMAQLEQIKHVEE